MKDSGSAMETERGSWTVEKVIDWTSSYFADSGIAEARLDAEVLLSHVLDCPRLNLILMKDVKPGAKQLARFRSMVLDRKNRKPVPYITGEREFMGLKFAVDQSTLIPRPETELLVEETARIAKDNSSKILLEIGTGSGNIAVSLAKYCGNARIYASDISFKALKVAQSNVDSNGVSAKVTLRYGDLFGAFNGDHLEGKADIIVSNPPYVAESERASLQPELGFEPGSALFAGEDGMEFYKRITGDSARFLKKGGFICFEMNSNKSREIQDIVVNAGFKIEKIVKDYSGLDRIIIAK